MIAAEMGKRLSPEERREQLLIFGRDIFARYSFDAVSMDEMAGMAGVSKGLLYHYFKGRRGFYLETVRHVVDGSLKAMIDGGEDIGPMLHGLTEYCRENAGIYKAIIRGGIGADSEVLAETDRVRDFVMREVLLAGLDREPSPLETIALKGWIAFVEFGIGEWIDGPAVSRDEFVELILKNLAGIMANMKPEQGKKT